MTQVPGSPLLRRDKRQTSLGFTVQMNQETRHPAFLPGSPLAGPRLVPSNSPELCCVPHPLRARGQPRTEGAEESIHPQHQPLLTDSHHPQTPGDEPCCPEGDQGRWPVGPAQLRPEKDGGGRHGC